MKVSDTLTAVKTIIGFMIFLLVAAGFFYIHFNANAMTPDQLLKLKALAIGAGTLLIALYFLVSKAEHKLVQVKTSSKSKRKKK